ncbi:MAG: transketolase [Spirochaetaceae bacterium]|nr:MAG: transketolase [Spirochaetaceae bacterium]
MQTQAIQSAATAVRVLAMDAVQKANSGHPGLPMGCAELGVLLYGEILKHNPQDPNWINRDRFVLSAGHGSMLLYSLLHLSGYPLSLEDIKNFRQLGSITPGHPEYGQTVGVETTTGPLGQGVANAVGMAIAERMLGATFNTDQKVVDHYTFVLAGDGDLMEGVSAEASSLAGHLGLGKLIVFYDSNHITIEGSTDLAFSEDVRKRYEGYGWQTLEGDAYDIEGILKLVEEAKREAARPTLILLHSTIAKGSPNMAGSHETHGSPLGEEEITATKKALGVPDEPFHIPEDALIYFRSKQEGWKRGYESWRELFEAWSSKNPDKRKTWDLQLGPADLGAAVFPDFKEGEKMATRKASGGVLNSIATAVPQLVGGSADLAPSNNTLLKGFSSFQAATPEGRNMHFGIREHAMGAIANGLALHGGFRPYCATFLVFSDYMRPSIRLAALMGLPVIYVFTHDSVFVGEDGPTHEPVEHLAALRAIPNLLVLRPADAEETAQAWRMALERSDGPTALALTRQNLTVFAKADERWREHLAYGAYIASDTGSGVDPEVVLVATGSEVNLALDAKTALGSAGERIRVVSMPSRELFLQAPVEYRHKLIPDSASRVALESGVSLGWADVVGREAALVTIDRFGESAPAAKIAEHLGFTPQAVAERIKPLLS